MSRGYRGKILYVHDRRGETGREWFHRTDWTNGTHTFRAVCELDDIGMVRDVTHTVTEDFRPLDCYARLQWEDALSEGWFWFGEREALCEALVPALGRISQRVELPERPRWFGSHPLCSDGLIGAAYDPGRGAEAVPGYVSSALVTGSDGPMLVPFLLERLEELEPEELEVPAGGYSCRHFRIRYGGGKVQEIWSDSRFQMIKVWNEELESHLVLAVEEPL
jgi:hypothetical protein